MINTEEIARHWNQGDRSIPLRETNIHCCQSACLPHDINRGPIFIPLHWTRVGHLAKAELLVDRTYLGPICEKGWIKLSTKHQWYPLQAFKAAWVLQCYFGYHPRGQAAKWIKWIPNHHIMDASLGYLLPSESYVSLGQERFCWIWPLFISRTECWSLDHQSRVRAEAFWLFQADIDAFSSEHREARRELGEMVASKLKLTEDGTKILWPQPTDSPMDPQNWSEWQKTVHLLILILVSIVPDFDSGLGMYWSRPMFHPLSHLYRYRGVVSLGTNVQHEC